MTIHPYLNFGGNCREAFTRYREIFGGELVLLPMSEIPDQDVPEDQAELIMHAALTFGHDLLMASDAPAGTFDGVKGMYVNYAVADAADAQRVFGELADGGEVTMPIGPTFWSPMFGMCVDRFGIPWMVNAEAPEAESPAGGAPPSSS